VLDVEARRLANWMLENSERFTTLLERQAANVLDLADSVNKEQAEDCFGFLEQLRISERRLKVKGFQAGWSLAFMVCGYLNGSAEQVMQDGL
jgi:anti-sigma-K factor RskA